MRVEFAELSYTVSEDIMSVELCVNLTGQLEREVMVDLFTTDSETATADEDYQSLSQTLTFVEEGLICTNVEITEDLILEDDEVFMASTLSNDLAVIIASPNVNITVLDSNRKLYELIFICHLETVAI